MNMGVRLLLTLLTYVAVHLMAFWLVVLLVGGADRSNGVEMPAAVIVALVASTYVWRRLAVRAAQAQALPPRGLGECVLLGALLTGAIAFTIGFAGPIIIDPRTVQGPMLGIFITGPLGFVLGAIGGAVYWFISQR